MDFWVPGNNQQYILAEAPSDDGTNELTIPIQPQTPTTTTATLAGISLSVIDKIFVESRSRANFAKNLTFAIYTQDERRGKNCTGRVFGKAQHKGQLDPVKLAAIKEATFCKYPCGPNLVDITWRKECITAIDSGLRNEARAQAMNKSEGSSNDGNNVSRIVNSGNILSTAAQADEMHHHQPQHHQQQHLTQNSQHQVIGNQSQTGTIN